MDIITELINLYKIGLLTNMYLGMFDRLKSKGLIPNLSWDVTVDSSVVGLRKPQEEIFLLATKLASVLPKEILFVENCAHCCAGASKMEWNTLLYDSANTDKSNQGLVRYLNSGVFPRARP